MNSSRRHTRRIARSRAASLGVLCVGFACGAGLTGCSSDDSSGGGGAMDSGAADVTAHLDSSAADANHPVDSSIDASPDVSVTDAHGGSDTGAIDAASSTDAAEDSSVDASSSTDSGTDAKGDAEGDASADAPPDGPTPTYCQMQTGLNFCNDFDSPDPLSVDGGVASSTWTQVVGAPSEVMVSSALSVSSPNSLNVVLVDGDGGTGTVADQSAKVLEQMTTAGGTVAQAIYEFDVYIAGVPTGGTGPGGFVTDFQFADGDNFGFRIGIFANATGFDHADYEHNRPALNYGSDDVGTVLTGFGAGAWNHVKMAVAFSAAGDGGNTVSFQLYLNRSATPLIDRSYPAPFAAAPYARFAAGMVYAFDPTLKAWNLNFDNFTLKLQ